MEIAGTVISLAGLVPVVIKTTIYARELYKSIQDAPSQFLQLVNRLEILGCELSLLFDLDQQIITGDDLPLTREEITKLDQALTSTNTLLNGIDQSLHKSKVPSSRRDRLQWMFKGKAEAEEQYQILDSVNDSLSAILQLLNLRISFHTCRMVGRMSIGRTTSMEIESHDQWSIPTERAVALLGRNPQHENRIRSSWRLFSSSWLTWMGMYAIYTSYQNELHITSNLTMRGTIPFYRESWDIYVHLKWQSLQGLSGIQFMGGELSCRNIISEGSPFIVACKQGDIDTVRSLLSSRKASPYDVTPRNYGPIAYAIEGGSLDIVRLLVHSGSPINAPFGRFQTSLLGWAFNTRRMEIARFLLQCGAEIDYLCNRGWTPVHHLWGPWTSDRPANQLLSMLCAQSFPEFNTQDALGAAAIHRAALWGNAEDIKTLINMGASLSLRSRGSCWTPAFYAASCGNIGALQELLNHESPNSINQVDPHGKTILHIALEGKSLEAIRFVLKKGADPHIRVSTDIKSHTKGSHTSSELSAADIARNLGGEVYRAFIEGLKDSGHEIVVSANHVFWPAEV